MTTPRFDELIHVRARLQVCAALEAGGSVEFSQLEEALQVSTSLLSKHLKVLSGAGYVELTRQRQLLGRPRTVVALTVAGRTAFHGHVAALKEMLPD